ncbi:hypothetical protein FRC10_002052 [Ceratobasidium sp. 414]|nr:hypothetical protein FRC10_002052 [Ceratobasidium sp. 414]
MSTLAMLIKARGPAHPLSSDRQAGQYSQDYDRRVIASITSSVIDDLVGIMTDEGHPASAKTLPLIESISKLGLLVPAEPGAASTSADRVVERSFDLMSENPVALEILNGFASKHESVRVKLVQGDISERIIQLLKHVDPQVVIKACDLIGKLLDQSTQGSQLPPNVSLELVTPLDSNQDEVLRAALDVAKILASRSQGAISGLITQAENGM